MTRIQATLRAALIGAAIMVVVSPSSASAQHASSWIPRTSLDGSVWTTPYALPDSPVALRPIAAPRFDRESSRRILERYATVSTRARERGVRNHLAQVVPSPGTDRAHALFQALPEESAQETPSVDLDSIRRILERAASKKATSSFATGGLRILDVFLAQTHAEYRSRVRALPVTIQEWRGRDGAGQVGTWKEFTNRLGRSFSIFFPDRAADTKYEQMDAALSGPSIPEIGSHSLRVARDNAMSGSTRISGNGFCEYWDLDNVYWSGECATAEEIEDGAIYAAELEAYLEESYNDLCESVPVSTQEALECPQTDNDAVPLAHTRIMSEVRARVGDDASLIDEAPIDIAESAENFDQAMVWTEAVVAYAELENCATGDCLEQAAKVVFSFAISWGSWAGVIVAVATPAIPGIAVAAAVGVAVGATGYYALEVMGLAECHSGGSFDLSLGWHGTNRPYSGELTLGIMTARTTEWIKLRERG